MVLLVGVAWAFESPSRAALLPTLVPRRSFPRAVTIASTNQALAFTLWTRRRAPIVAMERALRAAQR